MNLIHLGNTELSLNVAEVALLLAAGQFATTPETLPVFYDWLRANFPPEALIPADQIPSVIASVSSDLATPLSEQMSAHKTGARDAGARVP